MITRTVLVTGASGFVGRAVTARFLASGWRVKASSRFHRAETPGVEQVTVGDLGRATDWSGALHGVQIVVHLAARVHVMKDKSRYALREAMEANFESTTLLAQQAASAGVERFIFVSSAKVAAEESATGVRLSEASTPQPVDAYAVSKHSAEVSVRALAETVGLGFTIIRPPLVYGPGVGGNFRSMLHYVRRRVPLPLKSVCNQRSLVYVENLSSFIEHCAGSSQAVNETFFVSDSQTLSTAALVTKLGTLLQAPTRLFSCPPVVLTGLGVLTGQSAAIHRLTSSLHLDTEKATRLGWVAPVSTDDGLAATVVDYCRSFPRPR